MSDVTLRAAVCAVRASLASGFPDVADQETRLLLCHVLRCAPVDLFKHSERVLRDDEKALLDTLLERRMNGEPLAYLLGEQGFYGALFQVNRAVLIPRSDTELLVDRTLALLPQGEPLRVADLGTGSGAIAVTLARLRPNWQLLAVDISAQALTVARENAKRHGVSKVSFLENDWLAGITQKWDAIVSNPPYVDHGDPHLEPAVLSFEPPVAVFAEENGFRCLRVITEQARERLNPGGWLILEHGFQQGAGARALLQQDGFEQVQTHRDLAGHERVTEGRMPC